MDDDLDQRLAALAGSDDVDALVDLGCALSEAGRHREAEQCFRRGARYGDPVSSFNLGNELSAQDRWAEAVGPYEQAIVGGETDACFNLGIALEELGDLAGARRAYEAATEAGDEKGWVHLAWLADEIGDRDAAVAAMTAGAGAGDLLAPAVLASWRWEATGDLGLEDELRRGAERYSWARADLGRLLRRSGRIGEAHAVLERGVELGEMPCMLPLGTCSATSWRTTTPPSGSTGWASPPVTPSATTTWASCCSTGATSRLPPSSSCSASWPATTRRAGT